LKRFDLHSGVLLHGVNLPHFVTLCNSYQARG
jgi:hypothetical protein